MKGTIVCAEVRHAAAACGDRSLRARPGGTRRVRSRASACGQCPPVAAQVPHAQEPPMAVEIHHLAHDQRGDRRAQPRAHLLLVVGPGRARPDRDRPRRGRLPLHARRQADPRLQQPADVGEHRPRRPARDRRDHRAGDEAPVRPARVRDRDPRRGSARSSPRSCRATWTRSSSRSAAPRRSRTRSSSPATTPAATRSSPATAPTTARPSGR